MFPRTVPSEISEEIPANSPRKCFFGMSLESLILGIPSNYPKKFYFPTTILVGISSEYRYSEDIPTIFVVGIPTQPLSPPAIDAASSTVLELSLHLEPSLHLKLSLHLSPSLSVSLNLHHELSDTNPSQALSLDLQCISLSLLQTQTHLEFSLFEMGLSNELSVERDRLIRISDGFQLVLNKKILDIQLLELASRHGAGKNVNQRNVNQRRSPDDAEREAREMVLSQILFSHSLERKDVILRAAQMEQIVEKVCEERLNTGAALKMKGRSSKTPQKRSHKIQTPQKK
ncbi:hypothetical protein F2Q69_00019235 [Brassica cretica]|uniref:Uncharacterized protein n=1 Tax=Brassica cretica TaxID=69181 RepID=A0A8S9QLT5_BRACR|nr:hypothetical protein F2Q69_00019235 [Brassica cretica]